MPAEAYGRIILDVHTCLGLLGARDLLAHEPLEGDSVHIRIAVGAIEGRSLVEITQRPTVLDPSPSTLGSIGDLVPRLLAFGVEQFRLRCDAIKADYGSGSSSKP